jgi:ribonuclease/clavin/mitogillin
MNPAVPEMLLPWLWRLELPSQTLPPNQTTNSYLIANEGIGLLVDPGFTDPYSCQAVFQLLKLAGVRLLKGILLTHGHADHTAGLHTLRACQPELTVYLHKADWKPIHKGLKLTDLKDGTTLTAGSKLLRTYHTPGHSPGHVSFEMPEGRAILVGDLVAGEGSTWVGLPGGNIKAYLRSLDLIQSLNSQMLGPGHGPVSRNPKQRLAETREHRLARQKQILEAVVMGQEISLSELRETVYPQIARGLNYAANGTLLAHLEKLIQEGTVARRGTSIEGPYLSQS